MAKIHAVYLAYMKRQMSEGMNRTQEDSLACDLMRGVGAIAAFLGMTPRQTYHILTQGHLPAFKMGDVWCCRKSTIRAHVLNRRKRWRRAVRRRRRRDPMQQTKRNPVAGGDRARKFDLVGELIDPDKTKSAARNQEKTLPSRATLARRFPMLRVNLLQLPLD